MSVGFVKGAEATGKAIQKGGAKIRDHISPEETPSEVSPHVTKGLQVAKQATGGAVRVSQFLGKELWTIERTTNHPTQDKIIHANNPRSRALEYLATMIFLMIFFQCMSLISYIRDE